MSLQESGYKQSCSKDGAFWLQDRFIITTASWSVGNRNPNPGLLTLSLAKPRPAWLQRHCCAESPWT